MIISLISDFLSLISKTFSLIVLFPESMHLQWTEYFAEFFTGIIKKVLTRDFWVRHRWRAQKSRVSTFFNTGEKFRKIFRSLYVHRLGKNNEAVNEAVSVPRVSLAKPLISGAKPWTKPWAFQEYL